MLDDSCLFCKIIRGEIPSKPVLETPNVLVINDINPKAPIHYLIIPKKHIIDMSSVVEKDSQYILSMSEATKKLSQNIDQPPAFNIVVNNGEGAGQSVFHLHWHFLSGKNIYEERLSF